jgi:RHS repeat-associated protein
LERSVYRPYGEAVAPVAGGPAAPPEFGFTGQRYVKAAGVYAYGARMYDPTLGRFLQPDPMVPDAFSPQNLNRYTYVLNDPTNRIDPTGNFSEYPGEYDSGFNVSFISYTIYDEPIGEPPSRKQEQPSGPAFLTNLFSDLEEKLSPGEGDRDRSQGGGPEPGSVIARFRESLLGDAAAQRFAAQQNRILFEDSGGRLGGPKFWEEQERGAAIRETIANFSPTRDVIAPALEGALAAQGAIAGAARVGLAQRAGEVAFGFNETFAPTGVPSAPLSLPRAGSRFQQLGRAAGYVANYGPLALEALGRALP